MFQHSFCYTCGRDILHTHVSSHTVCCPPRYFSQLEADCGENSADAVLGFSWKMEPYMPPSYETAVEMHMKRPHL